jgi:hypothetical protein
MISNLVVAESPNEIKIHDAKNFKVECVTFYITPLHNIKSGISSSHALKDYDKLLIQRVSFTFIKHSNNKNLQFPSFCYN